MLELQYIYLQTLIGELITCLGMCERILMTPIPISYSRHTSRLLLIYCLSLPVVLVEQLGPFYVVPASAFLAWGLFSIDEFGHYIEDPFHKKTQDLPMNLPLGTYVKNILTDVERIMRIDKREQIHGLLKDLDGKWEMMSGSSIGSHNEPDNTMDGWEEDKEWMEN